ncbi:MAG: uroporphyrinogen-III C-methyltransferase [Alphaproteobacteria bacterium]|nr:MAG: uroporphyrinogen-III C-methyltransferase [Alphaproteobacteria bacterium]
MTGTGKVYLIGAGPGDPELMTLRAMRMLAEADVVVHDRLVSPEILASVPKGARRIPVGKAPGCHSVTQERINEMLAELALDGNTVARLKGGDPLIFGRGSEEAAYLAERGIAVEYAPGITAAQGAAASTGVPLTHRGLASGVRYVTGHRQKDRPLELDWKRLADPETTLVVYMGVANIGQIALALLAEGMPADLPVLAVANATTPREARLLSRLDRIAREMRDWCADGPVLFVIGRVAGLAVARGLDLDETLTEARVAGHG